MTDTKSKDLIQRYTAGQRMNHWLIALTFILLTVSGLALFHPAFYWMSNLLGGGTWSRILHPFIGVLMFVCFFVFAIRMFCHNMMKSHDWKWLGSFTSVIKKEHDKVPLAGRYNGGQKILFFLMVISMLVLLATGAVMWREFFTFFFPIEIVRLASLLHAVFAFLLILGIIVHIYAGIWVKGSVRAMTRGTVTPGWAWKHHRLWFRNVRKP